MSSLILLSRKCFQCTCLERILFNISTQTILLTVRNDTQVLYNLAIMTVSCSCCISRLFGAGLLPHVSCLTTALNWQYWLCQVHDLGVAAAAAPPLRHRTSAPPVRLSDFCLCTLTSVSRTSASTPPWGASALNWGWCHVCNITC